MKSDSLLIKHDDPILITGAAGFIGSRVVENLLNRGFRNLRCFVRPSGSPARYSELTRHNSDRARIEIVPGNLLSREDCERASKDAAVIFHLAAGRGEKSYPDAFMNSVLTTRNLLDATLKHGSLKRFVNISSFAVYTNRNKPEGRTLDESCSIEQQPTARGEAYCFAKVKQDELVLEYARGHNLPYVIVRPGYVFGPGKTAITGRVGITTFGFFMHMGGRNTIPFTYVDNCADAIVLAGLIPGINGEVFNVVDDDLPSSRQFLGLYKKHVTSFPSVYFPHWLSYGFCRAWQSYSAWSQDQLPPVFNSGRWHANWKKTYYSNVKLKTRLGWAPAIPMNEALQRYFDGCKRQACA